MWAFGELDRKLLLTPKLLYFFVGSIFYAFSAFRIQFCHEYFGFGADKAGDISAIMSLSGFIFMPVWSSVADRLQRHRLILALLAISTCIVFALLLIRFEESSNYSYAMVIFALYGAVLAGTLPLTDYQILKLLTTKFNAPRTLYGRQRMMGTISYGLTSWLVGKLLDMVGAKILFCLLPVFSLIFVILLYVFGHPDGEDHLFTKEKSNVPSVAPSSMVFFTSFKFVSFLFIVFVTGCGRQVLQVFLPPFLKDYMHMSNEQAGRAVVSSTVFSIVFMFIGGNLIAFFGVYLMLLLSMLVMGVRIGLYVFLPQSPDYAPAVYAIELLNGLTFSFTHLAGVKIAAEFAPPGLEATSQAVYTNFYMQLPAVFVAFIGGRLYAIAGPVALFKCSSLLILSILLIVTTKFFLAGNLVRSTLESCK